MVDRAPKLSGEQPGHRREVDVRMRTHVDPLAGREPRRAELVDEHERPDHAALRARDRAPHLEAAEVVGDGDDGLENAHAASSSG